MQSCGAIQLRHCFVYHVGPRDLFPMSAHESRETCFSCRPPRFVSPCRPTRPTRPARFPCRSTRLVFPCRPAKLVFHVDPRARVSPCRPTRPTRPVFHVDPRDLFFFFMSAHETHETREVPVSTHDICFHVGPRDLFSMSTHETCFPSRPTKPARHVFHVDPRDSRDSHVPL